MDCYSCIFFNDLYATKTSFVQQVFNIVGPQTTNVLTLALSIWIIVQGFSSILQPASATQRLQNIVKTGIMAIIVGLAIRTGSGTPLVNEWILDPLEDMGLKLGMAILDNVKGGIPMPASASNAYSQFAYIVEQQIFRVIRVPGLLLEAKSGWLSILTGQFVLAAIMSLLLILPYAFIFCLVGAFLLEAMFKFVAIGIVAPILAPAVLFQPTRPFTVAGVRILVGAFFTLVFTGGAMGFTMKTVDFYTYKMQRQACDTVADDAAARTKLKCSDLVVPAGYQDIPDSDKAGELSLLNLNIYMMFIIGFASILLHLQAKALASNISGANDGAGPAAATVAAMKGLAGGAAFYAMRSGFGSGGLGSSAQQLLRGEAMRDVTGSGLQGVGQLLQQHGLVGGALIGAGDRIGRSFAALRADSNSGGAPGGSPAWANTESWRKTGDLQRFSAGQPGQTTTSGTNPAAGANLRNRNG